MQPDWTTVVEHSPRPSRPEIIDHVLSGYGDVQRRVNSLVTQARIGRSTWRKRQPEGDRLDLDSTIRAAIDRRSGQVPADSKWVSLNEGAALHNRLAGRPCEGKAAIAAKTRHRPTRASDLDTASALVLRAMACWIDSSRRSRRCSRAHQPANSDSGQAIALELVPFRLDSRITLV